MKKATMSLVLFSCLLLVPAASATWGSFISTGTATGIGNPSCAPISTGQVACAVRSNKAAIMVNTFNGTSWGTWKSLAGTVSSDPSCTSDGKGNVFCAATATNGDLQVSVLKSGIWSTPTKINASLYSAPSCAEYIAGQVLCAARSSSGGLTWSVYNGTAWSAFANLVTSATSAPSCSTDDSGGVVCMVFTTGYANLVNRYVGGGWEGFINIGGIGGAVPDCTSMNLNGNVACFEWGGDIPGIFVTRYDGLGWAQTDWSSYAAGGLGGQVNENTNCTSQAAGELVCGVYGVGPYDSAFFANVYNGSAWSNWIQIGGTGTGIGVPACSPLGAGQVVCVAMGINNKLTSVVGP